MSITSRLSIQGKTYLLVSLSAIVALVLSLVSNNGLNTIRAELNDLIFSTKIERYTNKLILAEQSYRLNANGSVYDINAANRAYSDALKYVDEIYKTLDTNRNGAQNEPLRENLKKIRHATDEYKDLYIRGVSLLSGLNKHANTLETEGERITREIQEYVEAKRVDIKQELSEQTIEKINNGSNIWQYTYVTRLHEKKYRLNPDVLVFDTFNKDFQFMMSEWARLKNMSGQTFEFEKLKNFKTAATKYEDAMLSWVTLNQQLVTDVLPKMKQLGNAVIASAIQSAQQSIWRMSDKQNNIALTLLAVSVATIIFGLIFGAIIARSISSVIFSFQNGLLDFFQYLNQQRKTVQPIVVQGHDEISVMAQVVNVNIVKIQDVMNRKADYQQALLEWSKVDYQDDNLTLNKATELSAKALHVERVGIWLFNDEKTSLHCADLFLSDTGQHERGAVITERAYPGYFKAICEGEILVVNNARKDTRTQEFSKDFLQPFNIYSILDLPIVQGKKLIGIIRYEKTGKIKLWQPDEQEFANSVVNAVSLSLEIKKRRLIQEELRAQKDIFHYHAHHDVLTGLPNRFLFDDRLNQTIKQAHRNQSKIAVLFLDLDHFKGINDSMGHKAGDDLLIEVAQRLKKHLRDTDTLARLGGDEFAIVLDGVADNDGVKTITQTLIKVMETPVELFNHSLYVTLSVGVAIYPEDGDNAETLLKHADTAMYQAKKDGRNTYQFYTQEMTEKAFERIAMGADFRNALSNEEFIVHYQPQVDAATSRIVGMEALVRWLHPEMGLVLPAKFLNFANDTGLIVPLDQWVMKTAMGQITEWHDAGMQPGVLALNLSMRHLQTENFIDNLLYTMKQTRCLPQWLELEVTEGQIMEDSSLAIETLHKIKKLGISLAIDDFGTGYSSLSQLKRLPINKLKIDRSFVCDLPHDEEDVMLSKTVIALSKNMRLSVVAEGVETRQQKDFMLQNGCRYIQGYYYGKPMPADAFTKFLQTPISV